jgi:hypothetical protein
MFFMSLPFLVLCGGKIRLGGKKGKQESPETAKDGAFGLFFPSFSDIPRDEKLTAKRVARVLLHFHGMEVEFGVFPRHGTQICRFFHGMEVKFRKSSTPWK